MFTVIFTGVPQVPLLTLNEMVETLARAMADWPDPGNGQVSATPDLRTLRWYASIGLMDRPVAWRGRAALYGARHRLQVLAVKRLQLAAWTIVAIQRRLLGADDALLAAVARGGLPGERPEGAVFPAEARRKKDFSATDDEAEPAGTSDATAPAAGAPAAKTRGRRGDGAFWFPATASAAGDAALEMVAPTDPRDGLKFSAKLAAKLPAKLPAQLPAKHAAPSGLRRHVDLGHGAEIVLPVDDLDVVDALALEQALAPLRAWWARHQSPSLIPKSPIPGAKPVPVGSDKTR